jgi:hypothetical protein
MRIFVDYTSCKNLNLGFGTTDKHEIYTDDLSHILSLDWHNRFLRNWELKISNLYYIHYVKNSFHYRLPITDYRLPITDYRLPMTHDP